MVQPKINKKAQVAGQVFVYLFALVVVSLVVVFGYNAINSLIKQSEQASYINFKTSVLSSIESVMSDYGTVKKGVFTLPSGFNKVCFIDLTFTPKDPSQIKLYNKLIIESWNNRVKANIFLIKDEMIVPFFSGDDDTSRPFFKAEDGIYHDYCPPVKSGKITIRMEGKGDYVLISEWKT